MRRLGQQRDGVRQQSTDRFQAREGGQDDQRPPETAFARVVGVIVVVTAVVMIVIMILVVVVLSMIVVIMLTFVMVAAAHVPNIAKRDGGTLKRGLCGE
jgi:Flp pilus assembly protein TadB